MEGNETENMEEIPEEIPDINTENSAEESEPAAEEKNDTAEAAAGTEPTDNDTSEAAKENTPTDGGTEAENAPEKIEENKEESGGEDSVGKKGKGKKKAIIISSCAAGFLAAVYLGGAAFYSSHFFIGTNVGGTDISNMTVAKAEQTIGNDLDNYTFTFFEKDDKQETITGDEIHLTHGTAEGLEEMRAQQNPFAWPASFKTNVLPLKTEVTYDEDALYNRLTEMDFMAKTRESIVGQAQNIYYADGEYVISDNDHTEIVSLNSLYEKVKPKIYGLYKGMSLEKESCYEGLAQEDTIKGVLNMLNRYVGTKVTYLNGDNSTLLDGSTINDWLTVSDDYIIRIDEEKARAYIDTLAKGYDSIGKARTFRTSSGSDITVSGGNYGWCVNNASETAALLDIIRGGETVEREPVYKQQARVHGTNDIGSTYVEINLGAQHMWYYKDGSLVVSSDVVTGNPNKNNATPAGVYRIAYTDKNVTLKGEDYETPVSFWMPFNGGIGLHDATWRGTFGGSIYRGGGSHGCVNLPYSVAQTLFNNISPGDPVVVY